MVLILARVLLATAILAVVAGAGAVVPLASAGQAQPQANVGPGQYFFGTVNGNHTQAVVYVFCPGPIGGDRTGPPVGDQPLGVLRVGKGSDRGYTDGTARAIVVTFTDDSSERVRLVEYGITKPVPTSLALPCEGTGVIRFRSVPVSQTSVPDEVTVTYQNIGV
jgi:hypothetical protein